MMSNRVRPPDDFADTVTLGTADGLPSPELEAQATAELLARSRANDRRTAELAAVAPIDRDQAMTGLPQQPLTLLLVDVDGFEGVVDKHGEAAGEGLMAEILERAQAAVRHSDRALRWSRRELLVIASGQGHGNQLGSRVADTLRAAVAEREFGPLGKVTISVGVTESLGQESGAAVFQRLGRLLALTRDQGPNRVVVDHRERHTGP
jgi:diguanylate cyclase (GGDEF)-like protein